MKDILQLLNEKYEGKYSYLRIGNVNVSMSDKRATVVFLLPEEIFDYSFNSSDIERINGAVSDSLDGAYKVYCKFEKIILSEEIFKNALIEHMEKYFPLIAANIDYARITLSVGSVLTIRMAIPENIRNYMATVSFEERIKAFALERFVIEAQLEYEVLPDEIVAKRFTPNQANRYGRTVQVRDKKILFGKENELLPPAIHIAALKGDGQDVVCCGKVKHLRYNTRDESKKVEGKRFYRNYYTFSIDDTTGHLNVFINLDGEIPLLTEGAEVVCRGRVNLRDDMVSFGMYARAVALCSIPFDVIYEQTKPLSTPENYSVLQPKPYDEIVYTQLSITSDPQTERPSVFLEPTVTVAIRSIKTERAFVPYEIAMCHVEGKDIVEYLHTFLKVHFTEKSDRAEYANAKGYASPRFASIIPDLIKFTEGKTMIAANPQFVLELLNGTAKPLRYLFKNEILPFSETAEIKGKNALDEAIAMARILLGYDAE